MDWEGSGSAGDDAVDAEGLLEPAIASVDAEYDGYDEYAEEEE